jgi:hypothetical protein
MTMSIQETVHPTNPASSTGRVENTTDATRGYPIAERARTRKAELEEALALLPVTEQRGRADIERALSEVEQWLAGDAEHLSHVTAKDLNRWLEATKHLAPGATKTQE